LTFKLLDSLLFDYSILIKQGGLIMQEALLDSFDGGFIMVPWDRFDELVEWYSTHMDLKIVFREDFPHDRMASLSMPTVGQFTLKASRVNHPHFSIEWGNNGNIRFCFETMELNKTLAYFLNENILTSEIQKGPGGLNYFDFFDPAGTRITINTPHPDFMEFVQQAPTARVACMCPPRYGVSDLDIALEWYKKHLGIQVMAVTDEGKNALIQIGREEGCPVWLETVTENNSIQGHNVAAQVYYVIRNWERFKEVNHQFIDKSISVTTIVGDEGLAMFNLFDLDGNPINVWTFRGADTVGS
jgi:catechol 2,3-dioxygenase-like lactoylglutathione lyase family enzyme